MATLKMTRPHGSPSLDDAKAKVQQLLEEMKPNLDKYVERVDWNREGTEARVRGRHVSGTFGVDARNFLIDLKLSLAASLLRGKIETRIDEAIRANF